MRTEMSVVSQSDMYEGANMSNQGLRMSNSLVRIFILLLLLIFDLFEADPSVSESSPHYKQMGPSSPSDSLIGHASSSETDSDQFQTPSQSASSESSSCSSGTPNLDSIFLSEEEKKAFQQTCLDKFNVKLKEIDPYGKIGLIKEKEILEALRFAWREEGFVYFVIVNKGRERT